MTLFSARPMSGHRHAKDRELRLAVGHLLYCGRQNGARPQGGVQNGRTSYTLGCRLSDWDPQWEGVIVPLCSISWYLYRLVKYICVY